MKPLLLLLTITLLNIHPATAQNSMTGDGFGGRSWYKASNYGVSSYSGFCICDSNRQLYGWGSNNCGSLGDNSTFDPYSPVAAIGMTDVKFFAGGYLQGAIKSNGTAWVWGSDLPCGTTPIFLDTPQQILTNAKHINCGINHVVLVKNDGTVWAAGRNTNGQLGIGGRFPFNNVYRIPVKMVGITNAVRAIAVGEGGEGGSVILLSDGTVKMTGGYPEINSDTNTIPKTIPGLSNIVDVKGNSHGVYALDSSGQVYSFGSDAFFGLLGLGSLSSTIHTPTKITFPSTAAPIIALSAKCDGTHALALDKNGNVYGWGSPPDIFGAGSDSTARTVPTLVASNTVDISAGEDFSYIVKSDGTLWATGHSNTPIGAVNGSIWMNLPNTQRDTFTQINPVVWSSLCVPTGYFNSPCPNPPTTPTITTSQPTCTTPTGGINITSPINATYQYSIDSGTTYSTPTVYNSLLPRTYGVRVKDTAGCASAVVGVVINPQPVTPLAPSVNVTQPTCAIPTGSISIVNPNAAYTYSIDGSTYTATTVFPTVATGQYNVTAQSTGGCVSAATVVNINAAPGTPPAPTVSTTQPTCTVATGTITITAPIGAGLSYSIDDVDYTNTTGVFNPANSGTYNVTVRNNTGCTSAATVAVIIVQPVTPAAPSVNVTQPTCTVPLGGITVTFPIANATTYSIDGVTYIPNNVFTGLAHNTYNVTVNNGSCISPATVVTLNASIPLVLSLSASPNPISAGNAVSLEVTGSRAFTVTSWLPLTSFPNQSATTQNIIVSTPQTFAVTGQTTDNCPDTAQVLVTLKSTEDIYIPNTFTPDNNGVNDVFKVYGTGIAQLELTIWNQWGEKLFSTKDKNEGWSGTVNGKTQPTGVYVYVAKVTLSNNKEVLKKGMVNLVR